MSSPLLCGLLWIVNSLREWWRVLWQQGKGRRPDLVNAAL